jgi:hypothetical protein
VIDEPGVVLYHPPFDGSGDQFFSSGIPFVDSRQRCAGATRYFAQLHCVVPFLLEEVDDGLEKWVSCELRNAREIYVLHFVNSLALSG